MLTARTKVSQGKSKGLIAALLLAIIVPLVWGIWDADAENASAQGIKLPLYSPVATLGDTMLLDQPSSNGPIITSMPVNSRAIVLGGPFNDGWYWLDYKGVNGYAPGRVLVPVDENYKPVPIETPKPTNTISPPTAVPPQASSTPTPDTSIPASPGIYSGLWLGEMAYSGNVRSGPGRDYTVIKGWWAGRRVLLYQQSQDSAGEIWYRVSDPPEAPMYVHSSLMRKVMPVTYESARYKGRWVNVNVSEQVVTAYVDGTPVKVTLTATGKRTTPTEIGAWKIYARVPKQDMKGGSVAKGDYYHLKDVQYVQYFHGSGEGLHATFWHDNYGYPQSHGCVNLSTPMAEWFWGWATIGTVVYVHY